MKKYLYIYLLALSVPSINAGSGSFWGGFGLGTFSGIMGSQIVHHAQHPSRSEIYMQPVHYVEVQRPTRYVEIKTIKSEPCYQTVTINPLKEENLTLQAENDRLKHKINTLQNDLENTTSENRVLAKCITTLTRKIDQMEVSIEAVNQKLKKVR